MNRVTTTLIPLDSLQSLKQDRINALLMLAFENTYILTSSPTYISQPLHPKAFLK